MTGVSGIVDVERFRKLIVSQLGLQFEDARLGFLADLLRLRQEATGFTGADYLTYLELQRPKQELRALAQELTVPETYFFRNIEQFRALREIVLPECVRRRAAQKCLRMLSAGCASGEEAYTLAMLMQEVPLDPAWQVSIRGVDINRGMLDRAASGRYSGWALRETPEDMQRRWLQHKGKEFVLADVIREAVQFEERNLVEADSDLWAPSVYDVVFCRNVMMYFAPEVAQNLTARIMRSLVPGGYLFLGHAETLRGLSRDFHLRHTHGTFYYQRKGDIPIADSFAGPDRAWEAVRRAGPAWKPAAAVDRDDTWVDAIRKASERIHTLTQTSAALAEIPPPLSVAVSPAVQEMGIALDLLREERFSEALARIQALPVESAHDPDVLLLHAVLLAHGSRLAEAEDVSRRLLAIDELNAGAHYVLALCRESAGDLPGAAEEDRVAVYLDPAFAMPRLHLGLLARRAGDLDTARRELGQAQLLLQREEASRLLLFGGGFSRETLLSLCGGETACRP